MNRTNMRDPRALVEARRRLGEHEMRVGPMQALFRIGLDYAYNVAAVAVAAGGIAFIVMVLIIVGEETLGASWQTAQTAVRIVLAFATVGAVSPLAIGLSSLVLSAWGRVVLSRESRRVAQEILSAEELELPAVIWAVGHTQRFHLPSSETPEGHLRLARRAARATVARYGKHALPGGLLHNVDELTLPSRDRMVSGWSGSAEEFLRRTAQLDEATWQNMLFVAEAARDAQCTAGWVNALLEVLESEQLTDWQIEAMRRLTPGWEMSPAELASTAARL